VRWNSQDAAREAERTETSDGHTVEQLYHGTRADLAPGDLVVPGHRSNFGTRRTAGSVYLTGSVDAAAWGAELALGDGPGRVYTVEPTGPIVADPNPCADGVNPTESYRSQEPLRVTGECLDWQRHSPEQIESTKDRIKGLDPLPGS
jgi:rifampin ADP-ribosylating transferase